VNGRRAVSYALVEQDFDRRKEKGERRKQRKEAGANLIWP